MFIFLGLPFGFASGLTSFIVSGGFDLALTLLGTPLGHYLLFLFLV
jgi:hypothetical protein